MSTPEKHIDQLEATVGSIANAPANTVKTIARLFFELRTLLGIHDGLPEGSPLKPSTADTTDADTDKAAQKATKTDSKP